jgi:hypothetical protein
MADSEKHLLSMPSWIRVGPFARTAQVAYLLGRVLTHAFDPTTDTTFNHDEAQMLQTTLKTFAVLLPQEVDDCARYCGAIGMTNW